MVWACAQRSEESVQTEATWTQSERESNDSLGDTEYGNCGMKRASEESGQMEENYVESKHTHTHTQDYKFKWNKTEITQQQKMG